LGTRSKRSAPFKEIQQNPEQIFQMVRLDVKEIVGRYLSEMMNAELTHFLGREPYERKDAGEAEPGAANYRNGSYVRRFTLKGIGEVSTKVPRDRNGEYHTQVLPRSKQYESEIAQDLCLMFLGGASTRTVAMMTERLVGRKIRSDNRILATLSSAWFRMTWGLPPCH
jgi:putative transposase